MSRNNPFLCRAGLLLTALLAASAVTAQNETAAELEALREAIGRLQRDVDRQISRRDDGAQELRSIEQALAATQSELRSLTEQIQAQTVRRGEIDAELARANIELADEQSALGEQLRLSYMTGGQELIKLLLSQESPAEFARMLVYYDYLNRHRAEQIGSVNSELVRLRELADESEAVTRELERLRLAEQDEAEQLDRQRVERTELLARLDVSIRDSSSEMERMRAEEVRLNELIMRLAEAVEGFPVSSDEPFSTQRGNLPWPIQGELIASFGEYQTSARRAAMSGVLLKADAGTLVRSVYHGRVEFAEWVPELGLLIIVNHGEDYWTLYGHNAALLKQAGEWVEPGEPIAEVGNTGGQPVDALYFEIRLDGEPVNPRDWIR